MEEVTAEETGIDGEVRELSAEMVKSPGEERGDSESGEGEWSLFHRHGNGKQFLPNRNLKCHLFTST